MNGKSKQGTETAAQGPDRNAASENTVTDVASILHSINRGLQEVREATDLLEDRTTYKSIGKVRRRFLSTYL